VSFGVIICPEREGIDVVTRMKLPAITAIATLELRTVTSGDYSGVI
jgi:hypothetical protein